uniref:Uncharacterized protein n=1 Tax=Oryza meyeriana var. granulata TaxID=110450 RepID=A0A1V1H6S4_9ORYZ|nr:hypothetical protein [Oryza meyeriana var. granulata]
MGRSCGILPPPSLIYSLDHPIHHHSSIVIISITLSRHRLHRSPSLQQFRPVAHELDATRWPPRARGSQIRPPQARSQPDSTGRREREEGGLEKDTQIWTLEGRRHLRHHHLSPLFLALVGIVLLTGHRHRLLHELRQAGSDSDSFKAPNQVASNSWPLDPSAMNSGKFYFV